MRGVPSGSCDYCKAFYSEGRFARCKLGHKNGTARTIIAGKEVVGGMKTHDCEKPKSVRRLNELLKEKSDV